MIVPAVANTVSLGATGQHGVAREFRPRPLRKPNLGLEDRLPKL